MDMFSLSRNWFDWCFENPEKVNPTHTAIYFFAIEHCNRMGWKEKFGFPTQMAMDAIGISKYQTYMKYFNELVEWGFLIMVKKSTNQYSANIISLSSAYTKNGKALSRAAAKHAAKQTESTGQSKHESDGSIDIPITILPINQEPNNGFGDENFLIPKMLSTFCKANNSYQKNQERDFPELLAIVRFLSENKIPKDHEVFLQKWESIVEFIAAHSFYRNFSLKQVNTHIQSILQAKQNGASVSNKTTGRGSAGLAGTKNDLEEYLNSRRT